MKNNVHIARLARGAVVSAMAACLAPQSHTSMMVSPQAGSVAAFIGRLSPPEEGTQEGLGKALVVPLLQAPLEWDKAMEREFRKLALAEARGILTAEQAGRLDELNRYRDRLLNSPSAEDVLAQIKRDRLVEKMEAILTEYVEFQETADYKRGAA